MPKMFILPKKISSMETRKYDKEAQFEQAYQLARIADALEKIAENLTSKK